MSHKLRGLAALLLLTIIWGYSWVLIKFAVAKADPFSLAAHRSFVAALALFAALKILGRPWRPSAPKAFLILGLIQTTLFLSLQGAALVSGGAGKTAVLTYTMPIWTMLFAGTFLGERIRPGQGLAGILALIGLLLIINPWYLHTGLLSQGLALAAALTWSAGSILIKRLSKQSRLDVLQLNAWQCLFGSLALMPIAACLSPQAVVWDSDYLGLVLTIGVLVTALGWALWSYVLNHFPAWQASLSVLGVPAVALLFSHAQTGEMLDNQELAGVLLIAAGLALLSLFSRRQNPKSS